MKINIIEKIINAIDSIQKCHEYVRNIDDIEQTIEYLGLCQELAITIGEALEKDDKDINNQIVKMLEEYCELVYQLSCIGNSNDKNFMELLSICDSEILTIKSTIETKIPKEKMVAVFLCHIASMWDSLDSVYKTAIKDKDWESYVMPVPYYSINLKGDIIGENYEYNKFPENLSLIDYKNISLNKLKPDIIFYINPYDNYNLITRVYPEFFSSNLLKITDKIVYIPYYLPAEKTMDDIMHMPGIKNAWRIVIPNEAKEQYLEFFEEEKIVSLGSPKLDKLLDYNRDDIPNEWKNKIQNKKVLFLNTHLTSAMNNPNNLIDMLEYIISFMNKNNDIVILWRPHPLIKETLKSFQENGSVLDKYNHIVDKFKSVDNGIYDDTSNLHRSIAISDGYIGSGRSSVLRFFTKLNKPIKIIPDIFDKEMHNYKCFKSNRGGVLIKDEIWQFDSLYNALFKFDLKTEKTHFVTSFEKYPVEEKHLFTAINRYEEWIVLVPGTRNEIALFNTITSEIKYIKIEDRSFEEHKFFISEIVDGKIFISYYKSKVLYIVSMEDFSLTKHRFDIEGKIVGLTSGYVFVFNEENSQLVGINLIDKSQIQYKLPDNILLASFIFLKIVDKELYIIEKSKGKLYHWIDFFDTNNFTVITMLSGCNHTEKRIRLCHIDKRHILFSTTYSNAVYSYDIDTKETKLVIQCSSETLAPFGMDAISYNGNIYIPPFTEQSAYLVKLKDDFTKVDTIKLKAENSDKLEQRVILAIENKIDEKDLEFMPYSLETWMRLFNKKNKKAKEIEATSIGENIWKYISDNI